MFVNAPIQTKRGVSNDPQTSQINYQHENCIILDQITVLEILIIFKPNLLCIKLDQNP